MLIKFIRIKKGTNYINLKDIHVATYNIHHITVNRNDNRILDNINWSFHKTGPI